MAKKKPKLKLSGRNGNAFFVLALAQKAALKAGWTKEQIDEFMSEAQSGDYNNLLQTCKEYFEVS